MNNDVLIIGQMYAETDEEVLMYEKCVQSLKKMGCKIMIADSSSCPTKFDYINLCDYYLYDRENRLFEKHKFSDYYLLSIRCSCLNKVSCICGSVIECNIFPKI